MRRHAKAPSAGSTQRQATGLGRILRGALATRGASAASDGSRAPSTKRLQAMALSALLATVALVSLVFAAASAQAGVGWAFKEKLGSAEEPTFNRASKMAIDGNGDLYVIDEWDGSDWGLKRFHPDGTPANFAALGTNVIDGAGGGECPTVPADCDETPDNETASSVFDTVAIDRSGGATDGNIYVGDRSGGTVDIFSPEGEFVGQLTGSTKGLFEKVSAVSVDEAGDVYVGDEGAASHGEWVHKYKTAAEEPLDEVTNADNVASFAVNLFNDAPIVAGAGPSDGYLFLMGLRKLDSETGAEVYGSVPSAGEPRTVDPVTGHVFSGSGNRALEWDVSGADAPDEPLAEVQEAGSSINGLAVADGAETLYLTGHSVTKVDVYQKVQIPVATIGPPLAVSGAKAIASGTVNPAGVEVSECFFEYGETTSYGSTAPCKETLPEDSSDHEVTAQLSGMLANGNTYHYRLVVKGGLGGQDASEDETLLTGETFTADPATAVTQTGAILRGTVRAEGLALTNCRFEWGPTSDYGDSVPCDPHFSAIPNDDADHGVKAAIADLEPSTSYHYRLVAENEIGQIVSADRTLFTQGKPRILEQTPIEVRQTSAVMQARINPAGAATSYHFEWGTDSSYGNRIPADHELFAGSGADPVILQANLSGLGVASVYHFRVVASNASGAVTGPDQPFETLGANGLPENRAFELVTPADKGAAGSIADSFSGLQFTQASEDGESFMYPLQNGVDTSTAGGWLRYNASRSESGWLSTQISGPASIPPPRAPDFGIAQPSKLHFISPDNSCALLESYNPLSEDTPQASVELGLENLYRWSATDGDYELISNRLPLNPEFFEFRYYSQVEASDDCSRVYFRSFYELIDGASGLYEWDEGTLRDAGVRPDGSVGAPLGSGSSAVLGGQVNPDGTARWNAVSPDGSRLFFTAISEGSGKPAVFMREDDPSCDPLPAPCTVEISASETAVATNGARFEAASANGSRVFFRANYGIDAQASSGEPTDQVCGPRASETDFVKRQLEQKSCDLYAYDVETEELTDLSADANPADAGKGAQIQGAVAIDDDGSHVYFAALGQLVPGKGRTYAQNTAGFGSANVYLYRDGEPISYVTTLAEHGPPPALAGEAAEVVGEVGDLLGVNFSNAALMRRGKAWTASTSADGGELLFSSSRNLTGYETGGIDKFAAYLYSANNGRLACVSCRPDGLPLTAVFVPLRPGVNPPYHQSSWLLAEPQFGSRARSISEDGSRVVFTSPDPLAPGAVAGKPNVYQWQQGQVTFLAVAERGGVNGLAGYRDMSADGSDIFIATGQQLAPHDKDFISDVYDVRVGGGFPFSEPPPECQVDEAVPLEPNQIYCQGDRTPQPGAPSPSSAGFKGPGNPPETKPRRRACPKGKVRRGGKCVKRPKRSAKHKQNRAANSNRGGAK